MKKTALLLLANQLHKNSFDACLDTLYFFDCARGDKTKYITEVVLVDYRDNINLHREKQEDSYEVRI